MRHALLFLLATATGAAQIPLQSRQIHLLGRYQTLPNDNIRLAYPGSGLTFRFTGPSLSLTLTANSSSSALTVVLDHGDPALVLVAKGPQTLTLAQDLSPGPHTLEIYKRTETWQGLLDLSSINLPAGQLLPPTPLPTRRLLFLGDSVTCGVGVDDNPTCKADPVHPSIDPYHSYGMLLGRRLDAQADLVCYGGRGLQRTYDNKTFAKDGILNAPDFIDLSVPTDDPATRASWDPHAFTPDAIVVSFGTNDFNLQKTLPLNPVTWVADYVSLLQRLRAEYPAATIFATEGAIVTDPLLRQYIQQAVAKTHDRNTQWAPATHYPGSTCNGHPTAPQHQHMADDLEPQLRSTLHW